jgi:hypothetical protein
VGAAATKATIKSISYSKKSSVEESNSKKIENAEINI